MARRVRRVLATTLFALVVAAPGADSRRDLLAGSPRRGRGRRRPPRDLHKLQERVGNVVQGRRAQKDGKTRFMLLSTQRSGTHFLMHEIRKHRDVHTYDEIFYRHHRKRTFSADHLRQGIEMFFGARPWKEGVIDGRWGWAEALKKAELESPGRVVARGGTIQYNQGPLAYWYTFAETMQRLNCSVIHLVRRDVVRAEISHYFLNNKKQGCVPQAEMEKVFTSAHRRLGEIRKVQGLLAKLPVRTLEVEYETLLKDKEHFGEIYDFLGLEPPPPDSDVKTKQLHPPSIPWYDYVARVDVATKKEICPWREKKYGRA